MNSPYKPTANKDHESCKKCKLYTDCITPFMPGWSDSVLGPDHIHGMVSAIEEVKFNRPPPKTSPALLVVGEAPGAQEDNKGRPFVGQSGRILTNALRRVVDIQRVLYTNAVRCRPPNNKLPSTAPIKHCRVFIQEEIETVRPAAILLLGNSALTSVMQTSGITKKRRRQMTYTCKDGTEIPTIAAFHPAYALRDRNQLPTFVRDIEYFGRMVKHQLGDKASDIATKCEYDATAEQIKSFEKKCADTKAHVAFDLETNSLFPHLVGEDFKVFCCGLSTGYTGGAKNTLVVRLDRIMKDGVHSRPCEEIRDALLSLLTNKDIKLVAHNAKYDARCIKHRFGVTVRPEVDTLLLHTMLYPKRGEHDLKSIASELLDVSGYEDEIAKHSKTAKKALVNDWHNVPYDTLAKYCATDVLVTAELCKILHKKMDKEQERADKLKAPGLSVRDLFYKLVMPALRTLFNIEQTGFLVDVPYAEGLSETMQKRQAQVDKECRKIPFIKQYEVARAYELLRSSKAPMTNQGKKSAIKKMAFNPGSVQQVTDVLFEAEYFAYPSHDLKRTAGGKVSVPGEFLEALSNNSSEDADLRKFCSLVLEHKQLQKKIGTYLNGVLQRTSTTDSRVHPNFHQERATTGRLSCSDPNLQNIFNDNEIKRMFTVPDDYVLVSGDYSQMELRVLAMMCNDPALKELFVSDYDIHDATARAIFELNESETVTSKQRTAAKGVNFGIVYGQTPYGLGRSLGIPQDEAENMIANLLNRFPYIEDWQEEQKEFAAINGFVYTMFGRRRIIENAKINPKNREESILQEEAFKQVVNAPIQGSASDMALVSAIRLDRLFRKRNYKAHIVNIVHDSIMVECHNTYINKVVDLMERVMLKEPALWVGEQMQGVPIKVDFEIGPTWGDLKSLEEVV